MIIKRQYLLTIITAFFVFMIFTLFVKALKFDPSKTPSFLVGSSANPLSIQLYQNPLDDHKVFANKQGLLELEGVKGMPMVINFFASWCSSCKQEAGLLEQLWKEHKSKGLIVLGIAVHDEKASLLNSIRTQNKSFLIAMDNHGKTALNYGVTGVPETVFIDSRGMVQEKFVGPLDSESIKKIMPKIIPPILNLKGKKPPLI